MQREQNKKREKEKEREREREREKERERVKERERKREREKDREREREKKREIETWYDRLSSQNKIENDARYVLERSKIKYFENITCNQKIFLHPFIVFVFELPCRTKSEIPKTRLGPIFFFFVRFHFK